MSFRPYVYCNRQNLEGLQKIDYHYEKCIWKPSETKNQKRFPTKYAYYAYFYLPEGRKNWYSTGEQDMDIGYLKYIAQFYSVDYYETYMEFHKYQKFPNDYLPLQKYSKSDHPFKDQFDLLRELGVTE